MTLNDFFARTTEEYKISTNIMYKIAFMVAKNSPELDFGQTEIDNAIFDKSEQKAKLYCPIDVTAEQMIFCTFVTDAKQLFESEGFTVTGWNSNINKLNILWHS